ncbi:hypothetical protein Taro_011826 [Colocasia esculenta]|uniref:non-specific serine/threonine protein kinase n=1 Tax=Colocasia esculenta TaxID=4460 RepID=A0A843U717_COLES|nr:hypothetical protein [Colocasia esculenta]
MPDGVTALSVGRRRTERRKEGQVLRSEMMIESLELTLGVKGKVLQKGKQVADLCEPLLPSQREEDLVGFDDFNGTSFAGFVFIHLASALLFGFAAARRGGAPDRPLPSPPPRRSLLLGGLAPGRQHLQQTEKSRTRRRGGRRRGSHGGVNPSFPVQRPHPLPRAPTIKGARYPPPPAFAEKARRFPRRPWLSIPFPADPSGGLVRGHLGLPGARAGGFPVRGGLRVCLFERPAAVLDPASTLEESEEEMEKYEVVRDIGSGNFGVARLMRNKETKELVAMKYIERGQKARYFFQQLICGVSYCHHLQICHRDLKLENTLLDGSPAPRLKICDFGYSKSSLLHSRPKSTVGTPAYIAPEVLSRREYDGKLADVWSCGVTLYVMLVGAYPFEDQNDPKNFRKTINRIMSVQYRIPEYVHISNDCRELLQRIFVANPSRVRES